jgi:hypothetical protein
VGTGERIMATCTVGCDGWEQMIRAGLIRTSKEMCKLHTERKKMSEVENLKKCIDNGHKYEFVSYDRWHDIKLQCSCCGYTKERSMTTREQWAVKILGLKKRCNN